MSLTCSVSSDGGCGDSGSGSSDMKRDIQYLKTSPTNVYSTFYLNKKRYIGHALFHVQFMFLLQRELRVWQQSTYVEKKTERQKMMWNVRKLLFQMGSSLL